MNDVPQSALPQGEGDVHPMFCERVSHAYRKGPGRRRLGEARRSRVAVRRHA
jgi:hypothetical protein